VNVAHQSQQGEVIMRLEKMALLAGTLLVIIAIVIPKQLAAYEIAKKPGEASPIIDLRTEVDAFNRQWIERAKTAFESRYEKPTSSTLVYLVTSLLVILLVSFMLLNVKFNGLNQHLKSFPSDRFETALQFWIFCRWGAR
jgi:hypothetical protein